MDAERPLPRRTARAAPSAVQRLLLRWNKRVAGPCRSEDISYVIGGDKGDGRVISASTCGCGESSRLLLDGNTVVCAHCDSATLMPVCKDAADEPVIE